MMQMVKELENLNFHDYDKRLKLMLQRVNPQKYKPELRHYKKGRKIEPKKLSQKNIDLLEGFYRDKANEGITKPRLLALVDQISTLLELLEKDFDACTVEDIKQLVTVIRNRNYTEHTKHDYLGKLKQLDKWLNNGEYSEKTKWIKTTLRKKNLKLPSDLLTPEEAKKVYESTITARDRALIHILWETGARVGEIANLQTQDIQFNKNETYANLFGKTGARRVMLLESTRDLKNYLEVRPKTKDHNFVFVLEGVRNKGRPITHRSAYKVLETATRKAGITKRVYPHLLRHSRASYVAAQGVNEATLCAVFGWEMGSKIVRTYIHLSQQQIQDTLKEKVYGMKRIETQQITSITCQVCGETNPANLDSCKNCYNPLTIQGALKIKQEKEIIEQDRDISQKVFAEAFKLISTQKLTPEEAQQQAIKIIAQQLSQKAPQS